MRDRRSVTGVGRLADVLHRMRLSWLHSGHDAPIPKRRFHRDAPEARFAEHRRNFAPGILLAFSPKQHSDIERGNRKRSCPLAVEKHLMNDDAPAGMESIEAFLGEEHALVSRTV